MVAPETPLNRPAPDPVNLLNDAAGCCASMDGSLEQKAVLSCWRWKRFPFQLISRRWGFWVASQFRVMPCVTLRPLLIIEPPPVIRPGRLPPPPPMEATAAPATNKA